MANLEPVFLPREANPAETIIRSMLDGKVDPKSSIIYMSCEMFKQIVSHMGARMGSKSVAVYGDLDCPEGYSVAISRERSSKEEVYYFFWIYAKGKYLYDATSVHTTHKAYFCAFDDEADGIRQAVSSLSRKTL